MHVMFDILCQQHGLRQLSEEVGLVKVSVIQVSQVKGVGELVLRGVTARKGRRLELASIVHTH